MPQETLTDCFYLCCGCAIYPGPTELETVIQVEYQLASAEAKTIGTCLQWARTVEGDVANLQVNEFHEAASPQPGAPLHSAERAEIGRAHV